MLITFPIRWEAVAVYTGSEQCAWVLGRPGEHFTAVLRERLCPLNVCNFMGPDVIHHKVLEEVGMFQQDPSQ